MAAESNGWRGSKKGRRYIIQRLATGVYIARSRRAPGTASRFQVLPRARAQGGGRARAAREGQESVGRVSARCHHFASARGS